MDDKPEKDVNPTKDKDYKTDKHQDKHQDRHQDKNAFESSYSDNQDSMWQILTDDIDYKDLDLVSRFVSNYGRITPSRVTGVSYKTQRKLAKAIKRARHLALLPYTNR